MVALPPETTVRAADTCQATTFDDEVVVLNHASGTYQGLYGIGSRIWELVQEPTTVSSVCRRIEAEYTDRPNGWEDEARSFLAELEKHQLIETVDATSA